MRIVLAFMLMIVTVIAQALPYTITPTNPPLPTEIVVGGKIFYTVTNNTNTVLSNSYVAYLPANVTQVTVDGSVPDLCGTTFTLQPNGQPGDSCQLELLITGPVHATSCSDPKQNIYICASDKTTCAGPSPADSLDLNTYKQIAYIADDDPNHHVTICPVKPDGSFGTCYQHTDALFSFPIDIVLDDHKPNPSWAYIANVDDTLDYSIAVCAVLPSGDLGACEEYDDPNFTLRYTGLRLNNKNTFLYMTESTLPIGSVNEISICPVDLNGQLNSCFHNNAPNSNDVSTLLQPNGRVAFNLTGNYVYIPNFARNPISTPSYVSICEVLGDGSFDNCAKQNDLTFTYLQGIDIGVNGDKLYLANNEYDNKVAICDILPNHTLSNCTATTGNGTFVFDTNSTNIFTNNSLPYAYIPNGGNNTVSICPILPSGLFGTCTVSTGNGLFSVPDSVWIANFYTE